MENRRLILFMVLAFSLFMLWQAWLKHNQPAPVAGGPATQAQQQAAAPTPSSSLAAPAAPGAAPVGAPAGKTAPRVVVRTDALLAEISAQGGDIVRLQLEGQKDSADDTRSFVLFDDGTQHVYAAQSGLIGPNLPTHKTEFRLPAGEAVLKEGQDTLTVRLEAPEENGIKVAKLYTFHRGSYQVDVAYEITNKSDAPVSAHA